MTPYERSRSDLQDLLVPSSGESSFIEGGATMAQQSVGVGVGGPGGGDMGGHMPQPTTVQEHAGQAAPVAACLAKHNMCARRLP